MELNNKPKFGAAFFNEDGKLIDAVLYPDSLPDKYDREKDTYKQVHNDEPVFNVARIQKRIEELKWVQEIEIYCQQQGISPAQLMEFHKKHFT